MQLVAAARTDPRGTLYITALMVGLRRGELLALTWKDVDVQNRTLHVRQSIRRVKGGLEVSETKTSRSRRTVRMPEIVAEVLLAHQEAQSQEFEVGGMKLEDINELNLVFTNSLGRPIDASGALQKGFKGFLIAAGLPPMRFHDLRHSCASLMLVQGVPARAVMATLGHSQIAVSGGAPPLPT
jgi:integrase